MLVTERLPLRVNATSARELHRVFCDAVFNILEGNLERKLRSSRIFLFSGGIALPDSSRVSPLFRNSELETFRNDSVRRLFNEVSGFTDMVVLFPRKDDYVEGVDLFARELGSILALKGQYAFLTAKRTTGRPLANLFQHFVVQELEPPGLPPLPEGDLFDLLLAKVLLSMRRFERPYLFFVHQGVKKNYVQMLLATYTPRGIRNLKGEEVRERFGREDFLDSIPLMGVIRRVYKYVEVEPVSGGRDG